jgi:hypothetical protein
MAPVNEVIDLVGVPSRRWCGNKVEKAARSAAEQQEGTK